MNSMSFSYLGCSITVEFGDLFAEDGLKVITWSRFMHEKTDYPLSLQGQVSKKMLDYLGSEQNYQLALNQILHRANYSLVERDGIERQYDRGTMTAVEVGDQSFLLLALTDTEQKAYIVDGENCTPTQLLETLETLWSGIEEFARSGEQIVIPLLGSGINGIDLDPNVLLELNIDTLCAAIKAGQVAEGRVFKFVLFAPVYASKIDLRTHMR